MPNLFQTFSSLKSGLNQLQGETSGIGVGLSTAKALTEALGGAISIVSN
jgi:signal transduction histidine kinase